MQLLKVDWLINLPEDVLLNIPERVGTLDAIRTSAVSKRMLKLPAMLSHIDIVLSSADLFLMNHVLVANVIDKILTTRSPQIPIRKLKVRFILRLGDCISIGKSVAALESNSTVNTFIAECPDAFAGLTRLHLQNQRFGESDIPNILSTCKRLESLSLLRCDAGFRSVLHVEHAWLVELDISFGKFRTVELNCLPKLQRMSYSNWRVVSIEYHFSALNSENYHFWF